MDKVLILKKHMGGGIEDTLFPNAVNPIEIGAFRYDAKRMGGAPLITASVNYPSCLDDEWTDNVYAEFNGEKYYLKQTPTSSYNNESAMYKHDVELVSERIALDDVYFFDVVTGNPSTSDKPASNSTKVVFFGNIHEFVARLNSSLVYSGLDYTVEVDEDDNITSEEKLMSFEDQFFSNVLQEIYNTYEVPYYFEGKTIHIGYSKVGVVIPEFSYGVDDALLSITKNNANYKVVNRVTGTGSSDNIPFYYPNNSPKGEISAIPSREELDVKVLDFETFANKVDIDKPIVYTMLDTISQTHMSLGGQSYSSGQTAQLDKINTTAVRSFTFDFNADNAGRLRLNLDYQISNVRYPLSGSSGSPNAIECRFTLYLSSSEGEGIRIATSSKETHYDIYIPKKGSYKIAIDLEFSHYNVGSVATCDYSLLYSYESSFPAWSYDGSEINLKDIGLKIGDDEQPQIGDTITQKLVKYINTSQNLMPSVYRKNDGAERFYNAINYPYPKPEGFDGTLLNGYYGEDGILRNPLGEYEVEGYIHNDAYKNEDGTYIHFNNPFLEGHRKEHVIKIEDIKPTIEGAVNSMSLRMDMFSEFAYDLDDNDELVENEEGSEHEYVHSYFFAKLRKLDFNLFDHAIENQPMTISFTSGDCGACNFEIGVTEEFPQKNPVQVNADGTLKRDEKGRVVCGQFEEITEDECQPQQQDTINNEVWIALKKEDSTYGILMPKAPKFNEKGEQIEAGHRPKACSAGENDGDTFVILGINLPLSYTLNAEKKLEAEIIKYLKDNNDEKFTFSIGFSRIYFAENEGVLESLSENSKIRIIYNNKPYDLYVSSFSYSLSEGDILPEIRLELDETLKTSQNALQNAISQVKGELGRAIGSIDVVGAATPYFLRKDADDEVRGKVNFTKGIKFGEGGKVEILDDNSAKLTIEYLEITKKASFTSLEIQEKTHVGGQILVTPAAINCGEVEELDDAYRCYFQTKGTDGDEIFNQFAVGDQAICQTYNAWGSVYYWRLVTGIGEDYIDLSKIDCDEDSGIPKAGDKIIQLGNRNDVSRQNAIVIAAYGDGSPYIIQYKGINSFELPSDKIVTKLSSTENIFTGKVHMELGSDGVENLNLEVGGSNMLRNSGFTGDYLSAQLADEKVLEAVDKMFNPPLVHWDATNVEVVDSTDSSSGFETILTSGTLSQELYQKAIANESYVISFKAKGTSLTLNLGGVSKTVELTEEWERYVLKVLTTATGEVFSITNANCHLCEVQLERGTIATAWSRSFLDNSSDRAYYQAREYLDAALKGFTDIYGGLILTGLIKVGEQANGAMIKETAGINGRYIKDSDVAFWAGGTDAQAIKAIAETGEDEANFAVSHGGKLVANKAVIRGKIYAEDGEFKGTVEAEDGVFNGEIVSIKGRIGGFEIGGNRLGIEQGGSEKGMFLYNQFIGFRDDLYGNAEVLLGSNVLPSTGGVAGLAKLSIEGESAFDSFAGTAYGLISSVKGYKYPYAFYCESGLFAGLRPNNRTVSGEETLTEYDHTIFVENADTTILLPSTPLNGQEYVILTKGENTVIRGNGNTIYSFFGNTEGTIFCHGIAERLEVRLYWNADNSMWWATFVKH